MARTQNGGIRQPDAGLGDMLTQVQNALLDAASLIAALGAVNAAGTGDLALVKTDLMAPIVKFTGVLTGNRNLLWPNTECARSIIFWNATTGAFTLKIKILTGDTGIAISQGKARRFFHDGVLVYAGPEFDPGTGLANSESDRAGLYEGLVAVWRLGEVSGTRVDVVGGNNLTDNNTVTQAVGKLGNAAQFTAANSESLSIADNAALSTGDIDFTFSGWVYLDSKSSQRMIVGKQSNTAGDGEYALLYDNTADRFQFIVFKAGDTAVIVPATVLGSPATATWYFVCGWHDSVANTVNIQVNNAGVDSLATGGALQASGASPFRIGARDFAGFLAHMDGRVDEVGFWKKVLTTGERSALWNNGFGRSYPF